MPFIERLEMESRKAILDVYAVSVVSKYDSILVKDFDGGEIAAIIKIVKFLICLLIGINSFFIKIFVKTDDLIASNKLLFFCDRMHIALRRYWFECSFHWRVKLLVHCV